MSGIRPERVMPIVLVVDDELDMLLYLKAILSDKYTVHLAKNGRDGIDKALSIGPDLVISDIIMPELGGIELCKLLKSNKKTSHVPIILLTVLAEVRDQIIGIGLGADVYLPKPTIDSELLLVHVENLITTRNKLKDIFTQSQQLHPRKLELQTFEEEFECKIWKLVEANIANIEFNTHQLASRMFMSRTTFYRKLKSCTGMTGSEFIRHVRLNYAAKLLEEGKFSVSQIAEQSGFSDTRYFRRRFRSQFGVNPSYYKKSIRSIN